jgi:hypothetical protein
MVAILNGSKIVAKDLYTGNTEIQFINSRSSAAMMVNINGTDTVLIGVIKKWSYNYWVEVFDYKATDSDKIDLVYNISNYDIQTTGFIPSMITASGNKFEIVNTYKYYGNEDYRVLVFTAPDFQWTTQEVYYSEGYLRDTCLVNDGNALVMLYDAYNSAGAFVQVLNLVPGFEGAPTNIPLGSYFNGDSALAFTNCRRQDRYLGIKGRSSANYSVFARAILDLDQLRSRFASLKHYATGSSVLLSNCSQLDGKFLLMTWDKTVTKASYQVIQSDSPTFVVKVGAKNASSLRQEKGTNVTVTDVQGYSISRRIELLFADDREVAEVTAIKKADISAGGVVRLNGTFETKCHERGHYQEQNQ